MFLQSLLAAAELKNRPLSKHRVELGGCSVLCSQSVNCMARSNN